MRICVWGGGGDIAQEVIKHWLSKDELVTAVCRTNTPCFTHPKLTVCTTETFDFNRSYDLLITLPGETRNVKIANMLLNDWQAAIDANLTSVFLALRTVLPIMKCDNNVVVVGSVVGSIGGIGCANYAAAKAGLVGLVRAAANECASSNIRVNLLELGYINLGMGKRLPDKVKDVALSTIPLGRFGHVDDVIHAIEFLATTRYMSGGILTLAGGLR